MNIFVCDVGFGHTKFLLAQVEGDSVRIPRKGIFPSIIRRLLTSSGFFKIQDHPDYVCWGEDEYLVGAAASGDRGLRVRSSEFLVSMLPVLLSRALKEANIEKNVSLLRYAVHRLLRSIRLPAK